MVDQGTSERARLLCSLRRNNPFQTLSKTKATSSVLRGHERQVGEIDHQSARRRPR